MWYFNHTNAILHNHCLMVGFGEKESLYFVWECGENDLETKTFNVLPITGWLICIATNFKLLSDLFQWKSILLFTSFKNMLKFMEFKRDSVIALYLPRNPQMVIVWALQHLNVNYSFVSRTTSHYRQCYSTSKKWTKETVTTPVVIRKVKARFDQNPRHSGRKIAHELNISQERCNVYWKLSLD